VFVLIIILIILGIKKLIRNRKVNTDELLDEVADLHEQVQRLMKEKDEIMAMKVSQLGLKPGESPEEEISTEETPEESEEDLEKLWLNKKICWMKLVI
jgi:flagellar biosynthesis/type III secretory pathway M-ring protein FliF/YscJ